MPELPEVETIVRGLRGPLVGRTFTSITPLWRNSIQTPLRKLMQALPGKKILTLNRRGKYIQFELSGRNFLLLHLKMSGDLLVEPANQPVHPHVRTTFGLDNQHELRFKDPRKFGRVYLVSDPAEVVGKLGPEPLDPKFSPAKFVELFKGRRGRLKALLLNQEFIAGVGNIYADESCFGAGLNPFVRVERLKEAELRRLFGTLQRVLRHGIMCRGASFDSVYRGGEFQDHFKVYGRAGKPCRRCRAVIRRELLGARSTHFCPKCQPKRRPRQPDSP